VRKPTRNDLRKTSRFVLAAEFEAIALAVEKRKNPREGF
jgi:hypothetical protein